MKKLKGLFLVGLLAILTACVGANRLTDEQLLDIEELVWLSEWAVDSWLQNVEWNVDDVNEILDWEDNENILASTLERTVELYTEGEVLLEEKLETKALLKDLLEDAHADDVELLTVAKELIQDDITRVEKGLGLLISMGGVG